MVGVQPLAYHVTDGAMEDTTIEDAKYPFEVNLFGLARLTQAVLPYMREKRASRIVSITSIGGKIYAPGIVVSRDGSLGHRNRPQRN